MRERFPFGALISFRFNDSRRVRSLAQLSKYTCIRGREARQVIYRSMRGLMRLERRRERELDVFIVID